jgi:beta-lactam-binding protein with PASTA domain
VGIVVNQSVGAGATVRQGSFVTIWVSTGEIPVGALPDLKGLTFEEALEGLRTFELETGLKVTLTQQKVGTTDPSLVGRIVETGPPAGTPLEASAQVMAFVGEIQGATPTTTPP